MSLPRKAHQDLTSTAPRTAAPRPEPRWLVVDVPWRGIDRKGDPLELRLATPNDASQWVDHLRRITQETPWMLQSEDDALPTTLEQRSLLEEYEARPGSLALIAARPGNREADRTILGTLTLASGRSRRTEHQAELSMGVGKQWWGRGIGAILMGAGLTWAQRSNILSRVSLSVFQDNEVARRLYEKVGFATEGVLRRYVRWESRGNPNIPNRYEDLVVMGIWLSGSSPELGRETQRSRADR